MGVSAPSPREVPSPPRPPPLLVMLHLLPPPLRRMKKRRRLLPTTSLVLMTTWDSVFSIKKEDSRLLLSRHRESASVTSRLLSQKEPFIIVRRSNAVDEIPRCCLWRFTHLAGANRLFSKFF